MSIDESNSHETSTDAIVDISTERITKFAPFISKISRQSSFVADNDFISSFRRLLKECDSFDRDERFDKIIILKREKKFYVCGKLFFDDSKKCRKYEKLHLDIKLKHDMIPPLFGFDTGCSSQEFLEIRKIPFEPLPLTKQTLDKATNDQLLKMISQIISFTNFISNEHYSISILTLDDLFSCSFIDSDFNLYFGDLSFIEVDEYYGKNLFCCGILIFQLLGGKISFNENQSIEHPVFDESIPFFWQQFISTCWIDDVDLSRFYSRFMGKSSYLQSDDEDEEPKVIRSQQELEFKIEKKDIEELIRTCGVTGYNQIFYLKNSIRKKLNLPEETPIVLFSSGRFFKSYEDIKEVTSDFTIIILRDAADFI